MTNLLKYYKENVKENEYYHKFYYKLITHPEMLEITLDPYEIGYDIEDFDFYDDDEIIEKFKYLCQPDTNLSSRLNFRLFYFICFYLFKNGYSIKEFPKVLRKPPDTIIDFTYKEIRAKLVSLGKQRPNGEVPYSERRTFIANLTIEKKSPIVVEENINTLFEKISTRNANFNSMTDDEKLKEIANLIEYMLVENNTYKTLNYNEISYDYINNDLIKNFRKQIQCFRHASHDSINERCQFSDVQKDFLINYGILIINTIYKLTHKS